MAGITVAQLIELLQTHATSDMTIDTEGRDCVGAASGIDIDGDVCTIMRQPPQFAPAEWWVVHDLSGWAPRTKGIGENEPSFGPMTKDKALAMQASRPDYYWAKPVSREGGGT